MEWGGGVGPVPPDASRGKLTHKRKKKTTVIGRPLGGGFLKQARCAAFIGLKSDVHKKGVSNWKEGPRNQPGGRPSPEKKKREKMVAFQSVRFLGIPIEKGMEGGKKGPGRHGDEGKGNTIRKKEMGKGKSSRSRKAGIRPAQ